MTDTKTKTKFEHRLNTPHSYNYYGDFVMPEGTVLISTGHPDKKDRYSFVLGHGASEAVDPSEVDVYEVTTTTTITRTETKVN